MSKPPTADAILSALLTGSPLSPRQATERAETPPQPPETPCKAARKPLGQSRTRAVHQRWQASREAEREMRREAEAWYQAMRESHTRSLHERIPRSSSAPGGQIVVVAGDYGKAGAALAYRVVHTPLGWVSESALLRQMRQYLELEPLLAGRGPASLIHHSGRGWAEPAEVSRAVAVALLEVAETLEKC